MWHRVLRSFVLAAHWGDAAPLDDGVAVMAGIEDRHRDYCPGGSPVATGVGDSWACTNPSLGRGASIGAIHAVALRDLLRDGALGDPAKFARAFGDATAESVEVWYRSTLAYDRHRLGEVNATIEGRPYDPGDPVWDITKAMGSATGKDGEVLRARLRIAGVVTPATEVVAEPGVMEKGIGLGAGWGDDGPIGPTRSELPALLG